MKYLTLKSKNIHMKKSKRCTHENILRRLTIILKHKYFDSLKRGSALKREVENTTELQPMIRKSKKLTTS